MATPRGVQSGNQFVVALAGKSERGIRDALSADVRFRGLTPGQSWEAFGQDEVIRILFGHWFEAPDHIETIVARDVSEVVDRIAIRYRFKVRNAEGPFLVEQQGYLIVDDAGRVSDITLVCSGFQRIDE